MESISCHSNQISYLKTTLLLVPPICRCYDSDMERISLMASAEKSFENVDGRQIDSQTDGRRMSVYTKSSPMSK